MSFQPSDIPLPAVIGGGDLHRFSVVGDEPRQRVAIEAQVFRLEVRAVRIHAEGVVIIDPRDLPRIVLLIEAAQGDGIVRADGREGVLPGEGHEPMPSFVRAESGVLASPRDESLQTLGGRAIRGRQLCGSESRQRQQQSQNQHHKPFHTYTSLSTN